MKALILSCNTGGGHNAAGHAMKEAYERAGHRCDVVDTIALTNQKMSDFVSDAYRRNFSEQIGGYCRSNGLIYIGHII